MLNSVEEEFDLKCLGRERPLSLKVERFIKLTMIESSDWFAIVSDESRDDGVDLKNADYVRCAFTRVPVRIVDDFRYNCRQGTHKLISASWMD